LAPSSGTPTERKAVSAFLRIFSPRRLRKVVCWLPIAGMLLDADG